MKLKPYYLIWSVALFILELGIALFIDDAIIRPYVGDVLVVILIYAVVRAVFPFSAVITGVGVLLLAFGVELLQYFKIVEVLGLAASPVARTVIGTTFSWEDLIAYTMGVSIVLVFERFVGPYCHR
ncbi:MAG: DUF2809 domain-containing protein [Leptolyngbyaceae cyanobacterium]